MILANGTRVRLLSASHMLTLRGHTGTIVKPSMSGNYYIVRLDTPAKYRCADGRMEDLNMICETGDNMEVLADGRG